MFNWALFSALPPWLRNHDCPGEDRFLAAVGQVYSKAQHGVNAIGSSLDCEFHETKIFPFVCKLALQRPAALPAFLRPSQAFNSSQGAPPSLATYAVG